MLIAETPIVLEPVGHVERSQEDATLPYEVLRAHPARIVIRPEFEAALLGLKPGDDVMVLYFLHKAGRNVLRVHPRGDTARPLRGVFAARSPVRPNPIGVTAVRVLAVEGTIIEVVGLDAADGSPVLDLKIVAPTFDAPYEGGVVD